MLAIFQSFLKFNLQSTYIRYRPTALKHPILTNLLTIQIVIAGVQKTLGRTFVLVYNTAVFFWLGVGTLAAYARLDALLARG